MQVSRLRRERIVLVVVAKQNVAKHPLLVQQAPVEGEGETSQQALAEAVPAQVVEGTTNVAGCSLVAAETVDSDHPPS